MPTMADVACTFAKLVDCEAVWREAMEGIMLQVSPFMEEARQEERIRTRQKDVLQILETRFPGEVPAAVIKGIEAETDFDKLGRWHKLAITATLEKFQQEM